VLKPINLGIADGVQGLWWRTPVGVITGCNSAIEVIPEGFFVTYGVGVSLTQMRDPAAAAARVPVTQEGNAR
jgi:hypothetical protein